MKNIILLGATGSIGTQILDIIRANDELNLVAMAFGKNINKAKEIINEFKPLIVSCLDYDDKLELENEYPNIKFENGATGLQVVASYECNNSLVVNALVGISGLVPTISAIEAKKDVLLANKETLVVAGEIIMDLANKKGVKIIPLDSEHSAIYQLSKACNKKEINKLIITASGGAFRDLDKEQLKSVTLEQALKHPSWQMGKKVTIDSATMMNKGFELIEAHHLFNLDIDKIEALIHRESIIHSMIELSDGAIIALMSNPDMRQPLQYALLGDKHEPSEYLKMLDLTKVGSLSFEKLSYDRYPLVKCAINALKSGKINCAILNASDEAAVNLFLEKKITFDQIEQIIINALSNEEYLQYNNGDITITKILALHNRVYDDIYNNFRR